MRRLVPAVGVVLVLGSLVLLVILVLGDDDRSPAPSASSGPAGGADDAAAPVVEAAALRLLDRAAAAPALVSYTGTQFVSAWGTGVTTSRVLAVSHTPGHGTTWRTAGAGATVVRPPEHSAGPSLLGGGAVTLISRHYSLAGSGTGRVAGRAVDVVEARRPGVAPARALAARFWLDRATGLVLRREVYDRGGSPVRASAFVDVTVRRSPEPATQSGTATDETGPGWSSAMDGAAVARMRSHGWSCPSGLPGPLSLVDARRGGEGGKIIHLSYADGISSISVFQQRGTLDGDGLRGYQRADVGGRDVWVRAEIPRRVVWSDGGTVFTVVGDAPQRTVDRAVGVLRDGASTGAGGPMNRLGRGLDRVGSWFNPFE